jgi:hypothetical protein
VSIQQQAKDKTNLKRIQTVMYVPPIMGSETLAWNAPIQINCVVLQCGIFLITVDLIAHATL